MATRHAWTRQDTARQGTARPVTVRQGNSEGAEACLHVIEAVCLEHVEELRLALAEHEARVRGERAVNVPEDLILDVLLPHRHLQQRVKLAARCPRFLQPSGSVGGLGRCMATALHTVLEGGV